MWQRRLDLVYKPQVLPRRDAPRFASSKGARNNIPSDVPKETALTRTDSKPPASGDLRCAIAWLVEQPRRDARTLEEASRRFDLSPMDEAFLLEHFRDPGRGGPAT